ncbi:crotonobetainyl-CoA--carnitine CoA-transferase [Pseudoalteromonas sp. McH1-7]|uniref:EF-hand domain-containing protein n=1 Tax=Pseudoalteromonas peptidolytica F12-50-A1 TaxID=1315280 RepID=A0A8I0T741_9GAMM|nr:MULTISPECIES: crotonobetainyl-CoA--carnitine CoA-transferase [Pseudoalteromonas]MBE0349008.1 hypothetical protein [Pseudoalteromonas peptidolytica F12-50-A1]MDW7548855.1 crotonobetainyl-CoA--carnitine CoA-transferase [Pseudoalteromonas peptidolytica]NLR15840.1 crotonobetainyl-CoA--carnitine CoA-transferase [Pseudoalteromonas peptidolytica]NUZ12840.1 crotonobetainyl-CoA--carnitine CoA-transferase [Pseudoalteromonas sp. McH1-7]RRS08423.1 crotonobetainyl-CoA--carnitine CoA-transferase [Pseudoa
MKLRTVCATTIGVLVSTMALAATLSFQDVDKDKDGQISQQEASMSSSLLGQFEKLDADKNGQLSASEFSNFKG